MNKLILLGAMALALVSTVELHKSNKPLLKQEEEPNWNVEGTKNLVKRFEGLRLTAYQDSVGVWTIGYGHTGPDVHPGMTITEEQADELLE